MLKKSLFYSLVAVGGYFVWQNRFAIQERLESLGIKPPLLKGNVEEAARSAVSKVSGKVQNVANHASGNDFTQKKVSNI